MFNHIKLPNCTLPVKKFNDDLGHWCIDENGEKFPIITTLLKINSKKGIEIWRYKIGDKEADRISKNSMTSGTIMHKYCEHYLKNENFNILHSKYFEKDPYVLYNNLKPELNKIDNISLQETFMFSKELEVCGTADVIGEYDGVPSVIDFKNSRKPKYPSQCKNYFQQLYAYGVMAKECYGIDIKQGVVLMANWNDTIRPYVINLEDWKEPLWESMVLWSVYEAGFE